MTAAGWYLLGGLTFGLVLAALLFVSTAHLVRAHAYAVWQEQLRLQGVHPDLGVGCNADYRPRRRRWLAWNRNQRLPGRQPDPPPRPVFSDMPRP